jgi:hypothetical protein
LEATNSSQAHHSSAIQKKVISRSPVRQCETMSAFPRHLPKTFKIPPTFRRHEHDVNEGPLFGPITKIGLFGSPHIAGMVQGI